MKGTIGSGLGRVLNAIENRSKPSDSYDKCVFLEILGVKKSDLF